MSVISGTIAALGQRKSAKEQNKLAEEQSARMLNLELAARGAPLSGTGIPGLDGQESAILPYYFGDTEREISGDASEIYRALRARSGDPALQIANYDELLGRYDRSNEANDALAEDLATGRMAEQDLAEAQPVFGARRGVAEAKRNAGLEALRETLSEIDSIQAGKGYSGDSTGKRMIRFNARRAIGTQSAADLSGAELANAQEEQAIRYRGRDKRLANVGLADTLARAALNRRRLPGQAVAAEQADAMAPFEFFNVGPNKFSSPNQLNAMPNTAGDIANTFAQTGATVGGAIGRYYSNRNLERQAQNQFRTTEGDTSGWKYLSGGGGGGGGAAGNADWAEEGSMYGNIPYSD